MQTRYAISTAVAAFFALMLAACGGGNPDEPAGARSASGPMASRANAESSDGPGLEQPGQKEIDALSELPPNNPHPLAASIEILSPQANQVLSSQQNAAIVFSLANFGISPEATVNVRVYAVADLGGLRTDISEFALDSLPESGRLEVRWDLNAAPAGNHIVRIEATGSNLCAASENTEQVRDVSNWVDSVLRNIGNFLQLNRDCTTVSASLPITVNRAPELRDIAMSCFDTPDGRHVTYRAIASDEEGDQVTSFTWNPGDGSEPVLVENSNEFTHTYAADKSEVNVVLMGSDVRNGTFLDGRSFDLLRCGQRAAAPIGCGAASMTVASVNGITSAPYCAHTATVFERVGRLGPYFRGCTKLNAAAIQNLPGAQKCGTEEIPYNCQLGPVSPAGPIVADQIGWSFEVGFGFTANTTDRKLCTSGQFKRTSVRRERSHPQFGNIEIDATNDPMKQLPSAGRHELPAEAADAAAVQFNVVASTDRVERRYPAFNSPDFGANGYTGPDFQYRHRPDVHHWIYQDLRPLLDDIDGFRTIMIRQQSEFVAFARGDFGTAWCQFNYEHRWQHGIPTRPGDRTSLNHPAVPAPTKVTKVAGRYCTILDLPGR